MWPYFTLRNGQLFDEDGYRCYPEAPLFKDSFEAEEWLEAKDLPGNVR